MEMLRVVRGLHRGRSMVAARRPFSHASRVIDLASQEGELRVFMVAGEVSGDSLAARLMASLKQISPFPVRFSGVGGDLMYKEGLKSIFPMEEIAVMGIWELLPHLYKIKVKLKEAAEAAFSFRPHVVVTVDAKGFSFRFLKLLTARYGGQGMESPVRVHYVAPSFWAWKGGEARLKGLCEIVDHLLCILPFEEEACRLNGLEATFVGHPILEDALLMNQGRYSERWVVQGDGDGFRNKHGISSGTTVITLLPGSRLQEVKQMLPIFFETMQLLRPSFPELGVIIPVAPNRDVENFIDKAIQTQDISATLISGISQDVKYSAFSASQAALSTSGTAIMELQLARVPCLVAYRAHFVTEWIILYKTKLQYISLPNILLNSPAIPEALFQSCTPHNLASILRPVISNEKVREKQIAAAEKIFKMLTPFETSISKLASQELASSFNNKIPSMMGACTVLFSTRQH